MKLFKSRAQNFVLIALGIFVQSATVYAFVPTPVSAPDLSFASAKLPASLSLEPRNVDVARPICVECNANQQNTAVQVSPGLVQSLDTAREITLWSEGAYDFTTIPQTQDIIWPQTSAPIKLGEIKVPSFDFGAALDLTPSLQPVFPELNPAFLMQVFQAPDYRI